MGLDLVHLISSISKFALRAKRAVDKNKTEEQNAEEKVCKKFFEWLDRVLSSKNIDKAVAFNFNIYEDGESTWSLELVGTSEFSATDSDWACAELFATRENPFKITYSEPWQEVLALFKECVNSYLETGAHREVLKSKAGVGIGFVDSDLEILYKNPSVNVQENHTMPKAKYVDNEKSGFVFYGSGFCMKNDEQYEAINKEEADQAFKKYKREILDSYLAEKGFKKYKTTGYARLNPNRLVEYINLQKEVHGSRTFTLNIALFPLYAPQDFMTTGFGDRMGCIISGKDFWWDYKDDATAELSFENVRDGIERFVMPWFEHYYDEKNYETDLLNCKYLVGYDNKIIWPTLLYIRQNDITRAKKYLKSIEKDEYFFDKNQKFIPTALSALNDMKKLLSANTDFDKYFSETENTMIEKFKLPKKLNAESDKTPSAK